MEIFFRMKLFHFVIGMKETSFVQMQKAFCIVISEFVTAGRERIVTI